MKRIFFLAALCFLQIAWCEAQFVRNNVASTTITDVVAGTVDWGDYDQDGDLDLAISGTAGQEQALIYRNDDGLFTDIEAGLPGVDQGAIVWGDLDNDGDLDILLSGTSSKLVDLGGGMMGREPFPITAIFKNNNGVFVNINAGLLPLTSSRIGWGDYDQDGYLDIVIYGYDAISDRDVLKVYRNNGGITFTDVEAAISSASKGAHGSVDWGDYDNDNDLDLLVNGLLDDAGVISTTIYRNDDGLFNKSGIVLEGVAAGDVKWGDYDQDGLLDLALAGGKNDGSFTSKIYHNDNGSFNDIGAGLVNVQYGSLDWGDLDADGDLDLLLTGLNQNDFFPVTKIYQNDDGAFAALDVNLNGVLFSDAAWGDYDHDGDLDLIYLGMDKENRELTEVFENTLNPNRPPVAILLDNNIIDENQSSGTLVGVFSASDPDETDVHTFQFMAGDGDSGNDKFIIAGNELRSIVAFDFETQPSYSLRILADDGNGGSLEQVIIVYIHNIPDQINIPNAFSPNGDGANDTWQLAGADEFPEIEVLVFDQEGQRVFFSKGYHQAWDGHLNGNPLAIATYYYTIHLHASFADLQGSVTIVR